MDASFEGKGMHGLEVREASIMSKGLPSALVAGQGLRKPD
jgi:hypothetical protein